MGIFRTNDPLQFDDVDGIIIDEKAPPAQIVGVGTGVAILVGQFERGPAGVLTLLTSTPFLEETFGANFSFGGNISLANKRWSTIKIVRAIASDAALATLTIDDGDVTDIIQFDALDKGIYGNSIKITTEVGTTTGTKYTVQDTSSSAVLDDEVYDDVVITAIDSTTFEESKLVNVTVLATSAEPGAAAAIALASGSEGSIADSDYEDAIAVVSQESSGNILFLDEYNETKNGFLKIHAGLTQDKMAIMAPGLSDSAATIITAVASLRDTDGRLIYAANPLQSTIGGTKQYTSPASWYASIMSQTSAHIDPAFSGNSGFLFGVSGIKFKYTRVEYIAFMEAGVSAFEDDSDIGIKIKSGITTQIANSSKVTVLRRRMADFLTNSIAKFLKIYQNDVNSAQKRLQVKSAIVSFIGRNELLGILPKDSEVQGGQAKLVDINSLNSDASIALGKFLILYKQRIFSSMRFIVLRAEIGESVVVTEQDS